MKPLFGAFALSILAGVVAVAPAHALTTPHPAGKAAMQGQTATTPQMPTQNPAGQMAQGPVPAGSYQGSCRNARMLDGALIAFCRKDDGAWQTTAIAKVDQCRGLISNVNGALTCKRAATTAAVSKPTAATKPAPATGYGSGTANASYPPPAFGSTTPPRYPPPSSGGTSKPAYPR